ncbi:recombinase family protein [Streptomyces sp. NBC_01775]|uniref:recombinase family protein n=1 Tax=Streptomyces sp. NBC_01775 TaxID=2975939 RepID=UPI002DD830A5|nr:recombinase family protein [Streptomyces sp. NBC_01775]WSB81432.1 recombinase family protein [Streptomyces sp. NBC_01775]
MNRVTRFAFAGRCSTEDLQDPETSRNWQLTRARTLIEPTGGEIVTEYFDSGHSRALPWQRRPRAADLLRDLRDPDRPFDAVVIGEPQRTFYGNQFGNTFPLFVHFGIPLWVPEVGGPIDPENEAHDLVMSVFGGMSKGERNRIKVRVHTAMSAQAQIEGRYLGGRPPYGYLLADAGPHPNPAKAADGKRLHKLAPDPVAAPAVRRIFREYLRGSGMYAIAEGLTRDGILCPSAHDRARNPHRDGHAWSKGAVRTILMNPRYTGHQVWNKQHKKEILLDIDDVTLGHRTQLTWNSHDKWIWSAEPAHEPLVPMADFQAAQAQQERRRNIAGVERMVGPTKRSYALRGLLRCGQCDRKMQGNYNNGLPNYRCRYPAEYARSASLPHPLTVYVREGALLPALDAWIARTFAPGRLKQTLQALHQAQSMTTPAPGPALEVARRTLADCDRRIDRYRAAIDAGTNPALVTEWINKATADRNAAQRQIAAVTATTATPTKIPRPLTEEQIAQVIKDLGNLADRLQQAAPERKAPLYAAFGLSLTYDHSKRAVTVESRPESVCTACAYGACPRGDSNPHAR